MIRATVRQGIPAAALAGVVLLAGCTGAARRTQAEPAVRTAAFHVSVYRPFTASGALAHGVTAIARTTGTACQREPFETSRSDVYVCFFTAVVHGINQADPCFHDPLSGSSELACPFGLNPAHVIVVTPMAMLPRPRLSNRATAGDPWLLQLANGQRCLLFPSFQADTGIMGVQWNCRHGLIRETIDRSTTPWIVPYQTTAFATVTYGPVTQAWY